MRLLGKGVYLLFCIITLSQFGCSTNPSPVSASLNWNAELVDDLPVNPLRWRVITSTSDQSTATMATLFGNDPAVGCARLHSQTNYPAGSVICLVTSLAGNRQCHRLGPKSPSRHDAIRDGDFPGQIPSVGRSTNSSELPGGSCANAMRLIDFSMAHPYNSFVRKQALLSSSLSLSYLSLQIGGGV